ncbi:hypothetical protein GIW70_19760 [Pseudomonas syringae]|nr:hypothetical protein [Pseudomonas syringae]MCF5070430.1 hypothetical protein [Pseudomonas syringae]
MQTKSGLVIKLASSIETRKISEAEAAQSLEVSLETGRYSSRKIL